MLVEHCYACHSADAKKVSGGLLLDTRDGVLKGGATGPAVVPGDPAKSLLIKAVRHADADLQDAAEGEARRRGDRRPRSVGEDGRARPADRRGRDRSGSTSRKAKEFWSFQPVARPGGPEVAAAG